MPVEPFKVHILGCGSALPTLRHYASSQVVEVRDKLLMLDCSEGTQMQLRKSRARFTKLSHVFITHIHGDHCFGLIGMISTFGLLGRTARLHVHAPKDLGPELERQIQFFTHDLGFEVVFYPVDTGLGCENQIFFFFKFYFYVFSYITYNIFYYCHFFFVIYKNPSYVFIN